MADYDDQSLISLLDEIAQTVKDSKSRWPGSTMVALNRDFLLDLVYSARETVPDQLSRADEILADAEDIRRQADEEAASILATARRDAESVLAQAREEAARLVSADTVTIAAKAEAATIVDEAKTHADRLRRGADEYSDRILESLQGDFANVDDAITDVLSEMRSRFDAVMEEIARGRAVLAERSESKGGLRPGESGGGSAWDEEEDEVTIVGPVPPELADSADEAPVAAGFSHESHGGSLVYGETAPEPLDEDYR